MHSVKFNDFYYVVFLMHRQQWRWALSEEKYWACRDWFSTRIATDLRTATSVREGKCELFAALFYNLATLLQQNFTISCITSAYSNGIKTRCRFLTFLTQSHKRFLIMTPEKVCRKQERHKIRRACWTKLKNTYCQLLLERKSCLVIVNIPRFAEHTVYWWAAFRQTCHGFDNLEAEFLVKVAIKWITRFKIRRKPLTVTYF